jgi:hypothetical protein
MTNGQKLWLDSHKPYRAISNTPSGFRWTKMGMLHADGTFEATIPGKRPAVRQGSFEVGILEEIFTPGR